MEDEVLGDDELLSLILQRAREKKQMEQTMERGAGSRVGDVLVSLLGGVGDAYSKGNPGYAQKALSIKMEADKARKLKALDQSNVLRPIVDIYKARMADKRARDGWQAKFEDNDLTRANKTHNAELLSGVRKDIADESNASRERIATSRNDTAMEMLDKKIEDGLARLDKTLQSREGMNAANIAARLDALEKQIAAKKELQENDQGFKANENELNRTSRESLESYKQDKLDARQDDKQQAEASMFDTRMEARAKEITQKYDEQLKFLKEKLAAIEAGKGGDREFKASENEKNRQAAEKRAKIMADGQFGRLQYSQRQQDERQREGFKQQLSTKESERVEQTRKNLLEKGYKAIDPQAQAAARQKTLSTLIGLRGQVHMKGFGAGDVAEKFPRIGQLGEKLLGGDPAKLTELNATLTSELNKYIHDMTGASMGVEEAQRLKSVQPTLGDTGDAFNKKVELAIKEADKIISERRSRQQEMAADAMLGLTDDNGLNLKASAAVRKGANPFDVINRIKKERMGVVP